jgi:hypothetical protein
MRIEAEGQESGSETLGNRKDRRTKWIGQWLKPGGNAGRFGQVLVKVPTLSLSFTVEAKLNSDGDTLTVPLSAS